jgi:hypothetical protein
MNLIERIYEQHVLDDCDTDKASQYLIDYYIALSKNEQNVVDRTLITICGWTLQTLLNFDRKGVENDGR